MLCREFRCLWKGGLAKCLWEYPKTPTFSQKYAVKQCFSDNGRFDIFQQRLPRVEGDIRLNRNDNAL